MSLKVSKSYDKEILRLLTVVLVSNRIKEATAALQYYKSLDVHVVLSAPTQQFYQSIKLLQKKDDAVYILRPKSTEDTLYQRLSNSESWIKTPYFVIASDDDMLLKEGLLSAITHLEANQTHSSYYGLTATALFKAPFLPIINPVYSLSNHLKHAIPEPANVFLRYRSYPCLYGISKTKVFNTYLRLFPPSLGDWMGIWEFNYSIAVAMHGQSFYDENTPLLLRLVHRQSRSCLHEYPEAPRLNENPKEFLNRFVQTEFIDMFMRSHGMACCLDNFLRAIYLDVLSDSSLRTSPTISPGVTPSLASSLLRSIILNLRRLISNPAYILHYIAFLLAAIKYFLDRTKSGVKLII